jgi:hypothetical protein
VRLTRGGNFADQLDRPGMSKTPQLDMSCRSEKAIDRNGKRFSEQIKVSRAPSVPRSGFALDTLICSELFAPL